MTEKFAESIENAVRNGQICKPDPNIATAQLDVETEMRNLPSHRLGEEPEPLYKTLLAKTQSLLKLTP